jgi:protein TonB
VYKRQEISNACSHLSDTEYIFEIVEFTPEYPGGLTAMIEYIGNNLRYPSIAIYNKIEGTVIVEFVVTYEGKICNARILKDIGGGCGEEALRLVNMMPDWSPGTQRGKPVNVRLRIPVRFKLR